MAQAYRKLQYDFPIVTADELQALQLELQNDAAAAAQRFPLTVSLVGAVDEGARAAQGSAASRPESAAVQRGFQLVAGALFGVALQRLLLSDDESADSLLLSYRLSLAEPEQEAPATQAPRPAPAHESPSGSQDALSDSDWDEFPAPLGPADALEEPPDACLKLPLAQRVDAKLAHLGSRLRFELFDLPGVWETLGLSEVFSRVLQTLLARPRPCARCLQSLTVRLLCDRWMRALDPTLPAVLQLLVSDETAELTPIWLLSCLCTRAHYDESANAAATATLWVHVHASWSNVVIPCAQRLAAAACAPPSVPAHQRTLDDAEPLALVLAYYAKHAPGGVNVGDLLLPTGVFRNLVSLLDAGDRLPSSAPLRRAVLLLCCASPSVNAFASAVPAVSAFMQHDDAHAIVWALLQAAPEPDRLQELVVSASETVAEGSQPPALALDTALLLKDAILTATGTGRVLLPGAVLPSAFRGLQTALLGRLGARFVNAANQNEDGRDLTRTTESADKAHTKCVALLKVVKEILALLSGTGSCKVD